MARPKYTVIAKVYDKRGRLLSVGRNNYRKSHPWQARLAARVGLPEKVNLHAEVAALIRCRDLSRAYRIHVTRLGPSGQCLPGAPCAICRSAIALTPIKVIEHS